MPNARGPVKALLALGLGTALTWGGIELALSAVALFAAEPPSANVDAPYVILAEGDSFTYGIGGRSFPRQLEALLNERAGAPIFRVVNRGEPGLNTTGLVERLPEHLAEVQPDVVIVTIGENNSWNTYQTQTADIGWGTWLDLTLMRSRAYRFARVAWVGWDRPTFHDGAPTVREAGSLSTLPETSELIGLPQEEESIRGERETSTPTSYTPAQVAAYEAAFLKRDEGDYAGSVEGFRTVIAAVPGELAPYIGAAGALLRMDRTAEAIELLRAGEAAQPTGSTLPEPWFHTLALAYQRAGDDDNHIATLVAALRQNPEADNPLHTLAFHHFQKDGNVWATLDDVSDIEGIERNPLYGYLQRLSEMTEGRVDTLQSLISESFGRDMRALAAAAHHAGARSVWTSYPLHAYPEIEQVARELGVAYIDFRPEFARRFPDRSAFLAADGCHCNTVGYEVMAGVIAEEVLEALEITLPPATR
jgi:lysophospholipase L1-like esterase